MRILSKAPQLVTQYFGEELDIPADTVAVASNKNGDVHAFTAVPELKRISWFGGRSTLVAKSDGEGWKESLQIITE